MHAPFLHARAQVQCSTAPQARRADSHCAAPRLNADPEDGGHTRRLAGGGSGLAIGMVIGAVRGGSGVSGR